MKRTNIKKTRETGETKSNLGTASKTLSIGFTVLLAVIAVALYLTQNPRLQDAEKLKEPKETFTIKANHTLKYWPIVIHKWNKQDSARSMKRVLDMMSWQMVNGSAGDGWDLMWAHEYPFVMFENEMKNLKPHQRVNHFPGVNAIAVKRTMATNNRFPFIPPAFKFPQMKDDFKKHVQENPNHQFVEKLRNNRGVKIVSVDEIKFDDTEKFVQRFIDNPLLIEGHAFDIGVYVVISSIDPLRIYRNSGEILVRICSEPYHPFDPKNLDKYVVSDEFKMFCTMPSFKKLCNDYGFSYKTILENHLQLRGFNVTDLWRQIDEAIVTLITKNEDGFISRVSYYY
jgi:tubulin monoglycylase TTLL15